MRGGGRGSRSEHPQGSQGSHSSTHLTVEPASTGTGRLKVLCTKQSVLLYNSGGLGLWLGLELGIPADSLSALPLMPLPLLLLKLRKGLSSSWKNSAVGMLGELGVLAGVGSPLAGLLILDSRRGGMR